MTRAIEGAEGWLKTFKDEEETQQSAPPSIIIRTTDAAKALNDPKQDKPAKYSGF